MDSIEWLMFAYFLIFEEIANIGMDCANFIFSYAKVVMPQTGVASGVEVEHSAKKRKKVRKYTNKNTEALEFGGSISHCQWEEGD